MIETETSMLKDGRTSVQTRRLGTVGRLALLLWSLGLLLFVPDSRLLLAAGLALAVNLLLYPAAVGRLLRWRWLFFALLLIVPSMLWAGPPDRLVGGLALSSAGLAAGLIVTLRAVVVIVALDGFSSAVDISEVAGLLERIGLSGLGLSMGVAVNLLPALYKSSQNVWRTLQMRGGFRRQRWRALRLLLITVVAGALRRAEEIALAAEARGFSPEKSRPLPIKGGGWDKPVCCLFLIVWLLFVFAG